jgi:hypothetical protein
MQRNKTAWYILLCILIWILPISCDVQKRRYRPGAFIQKGSSFSGISYLPGNYSSRILPEHPIDDSSLTVFGSQSPPWLNYVRSKTSKVKANNTLQICIENKQLHAHVIPSEAWHNKATLPLPWANNNTLDSAMLRGSNTPTLAKEKAGSNPRSARNKGYENFMRAFLAGAGSVLLLFATRSGIKRYKGYNFNRLNKSTSKATEANRQAKNKEEIVNMADRLERCADRFANAKNERVELAARKAAIAINKCDDLTRAKELEKAFNDIYLSPDQTAAIQHLKLNNLLSNDIAYGGSTGTLKPDVVTTTGGYYANSAGSLSWTMGEPVSETVSDTGNTLTQGFQQGSYSVISVVDELAQPTIDISVYPNPVSSLLNIRSDSGDTFRAVVLDLQGNIVYDQPFEDGQGQIDLRNLSDAMYLIEVYDQDGTSIKAFKIQKVD